MSAKSGAEKAKNGARSFMKDFKAFISRGNVVDMAVGVIIGGAFGKIVSGLVSDIITPAISCLTGGESVLSALKTVITPAVLNEAGEVVTAEVAIMWGNWFQTIVDFLITAFFVFLFLRILTKGRALLEAEKKREEAEAAEKAAAAAKEQAAAAEAAAAAAAAHQQALDDSILAQKELLTQIRDLLQKKD